MDVIEGVRVYYGWVRECFVYVCVWISVSMCEWFVRARFCCWERYSEIEGIKDFSYLDRIRRRGIHYLYVHYVNVFVSDFCGRWPKERGIRCLRMCNSFSLFKVFGYCCSYCWMLTLHLCSFVRSMLYFDHKHSCIFKVQQISWMLCTLT